MNLKKDLRAALDAVDYNDCHSGDIGYKEVVLACTRFIRDHAPALLKLMEEPHTHKWDLDGERCVICGQKDWMSDGAANHVIHLISGDPQAQENSDAET